MARTRLLRPGFVKDADLYQAEVDWKLPLRVAFAGLWGVTDREGRFPWKPAELKPDALPHDPVDFERVLDALEAEGFVQRYVVDGKTFGLIPTFADHQTFHKTEPPSKLPAPVAPPLEPRCLTVASRQDSVAVAVGVAVRDADTDPVTDQKDSASVDRFISPQVVRWLEDNPLPSDAGRRALFAVWQSAGAASSRAAVLSELNALLSGHRGKQHHCTAVHLDVALSDYASNGMSTGRWNAQHFRACVRRAMQPVQGSGTPRATRVNPGVQQVANILGAKS